MPRIWSAALLVAVLLPVRAADETAVPPASVPPPAQAAARLPMPPMNVVEGAQRDLRETLGDEYGRARKPEERLLLGRKLLDQALVMTGADIERLAMLREAAELAARAGDAAVALQAIDAQAAVFALAVPEERLRVLILAAAKPASAESAQVTGGALCTLADDGIAADQYAFAQRAAKEADAFARRIKDPGLSARSKLLLERVKLLSDEFEKLGELTDVLGNMTPDAHLRLGRFLCFTKGEWQRGLPHLAECDDAVLKAAAQAELAAGADPEAPARIADGWYEISQKQRGAAKEELQSHALDWYRRAATTLQGAARIKLDKRLDELERAVSVTGRRVRFPAGAVLLLTFERETVTMKGSGIGQVRDASGHDLRGVATGTPTIELGAHGNALSLDGSSWLTIGDAKELQIAGNLTIAFWMRPQVITAQCNPFNKSYNDEGAMTLDPGGALTYFYGVSGVGGSDQGFGLPSAGTPKRWTHVALVRDLTAKRLIWFRDGRKEAEAAAKFLTPTVSPNDLLIGSGYLSPYVGQLDDIGVWPRALSAAEIKLLHEATAAGR